MESLALHQICSIMLTLQNIILDSPLTCISFSSIVSCAFILGRYTMAAKKNKELAEKEKELAKIILGQVSTKHEDERKHREELEIKDKEIAYRDREIYELLKENILLRKQNTASNNSS